MSSLKLLSRLRKYNDGDVEAYLKTQMRQNLKAIENALDSVQSCATRIYLSENLTVYPNNSSEKINFDRINYDSNLAFNLSLKRYECKKSGIYNASALTLVQGTNVLANIYSINMRKNGTFYSNGTYKKFTVTTSESLSYSDTVDLVIGDYVEFYVYGLGDNSVNGITLQAGDNGSNTYASINWICDI